MAKAPPRRILWEGDRPEAAEGALVEANSDAFRLLRGPRAGGGGVSARAPRAVAEQVCCSSAHGMNLPPCKGGALVAAHRAHGLHPKQPARPPAGARVRRSARVAGLRRCPAHGQLERVALPFCTRGEQRARGVDAGEGAWRGGIEINTRNRNGSCCSIFALAMKAADAQRRLQTVGWRVRGAGRKAHPRTWRRRPTRPATANRSRGSCARNWL